MEKYCKRCLGIFDDKNRSFQKFCSIKCQRAEEYIRNRDINLNRAKEYYFKNKERVRFYKFNYRSNNSQYLKETNKNYYYNNKKEIMEKCKNYLRNRYKNDNNFATKERLKSRIRMAIRKYLQETKIPKSMHAFIDYNKIIEKLKPFPDNIQNYHIDHIRPLCSFDFSKIEDIKQAFSPENHQWLTKEDNLKKGGKYIG